MHPKSRPSLHTSFPWSPFCGPPPGLEFFTLQFGVRACRLIRVLSDTSERQLLNRPVETNLL